MDERVRQSNDIIENRLKPMIKKRLKPEALKEPLKQKLGVEVAHSKFEEIYIRMHMLDAKFDTGLPPAMCQKMEKDLSTKLER